MQTIDWIDTAQSAAGLKPSGNMINLARLVILDPGVPGPGSTHTTHCEGVSLTGDGSVATPYQHADVCFLSSGARLQAVNFTHCAPTAADYNANSSHILTDSAVVRVTDLCDNPAGKSTCPTQPLTVSPNSFTTVQQLTPTVATEIHDGQHNVVTAVRVGSTVHDKVIVTGEQNKPVPTGNVSVDWFLNGDCSATPQASGPFRPARPHAASRRRARSTLVGRRAPDLLRLRQAARSSSSPTGRVNARSSS